MENSPPINLDKYNTIILDCDGVILDSNSIKTDAFVELLNNYDKDAIEEFVAYHKAYGGVSRQKKIEYFLKIIVDEYSEPTYSKLVKEYGRLVSTKLKNVKLTKGAWDFLVKYSKSKKLFVLSGGKQSELHESFNRLKIFDFFQFVYGNPLSKEENFNLLRSNYNTGSKVVFIGDAKKDFEVATQFEMDFIFVKKYSEFSAYLSYFQGKEVTIVESLLDIV